MTVSFHFAVQVIKLGDLGMTKNRAKSLQRTIKRDPSHVLARKFESKRKSVREKLGIAQNQENDQVEIDKKRMKLCSIRAVPRKFGISFIIPDRLATEISDKRKVWGAHPLRITRIPAGGPREFHQIVEEAETESEPLIKNHSKEGRPSSRRLYHRSRLNDWHPQVFYQIPKFQICPSVSDSF